MQVTNSTEFTELTEIVWVCCYKIFSAKENTELSQVPL